MVCGVPGQKSKFGVDGLVGRYRSSPIAGSSCVVRRHKLRPDQVGTGHFGKACDEEVRSSCGRRSRCRASADGGCAGHDASSQLGAMTDQLVAERVDQCVHTSAASASVVQTPATVCAAIRAAGCAAAPSTVDVGAVVQPAVGSRSSAVGHLGRPGVGAALTAGHLRCRLAAGSLSRRIAQVS
jgi:hypothetical protein